MTPGDADLLDLPDAAAWEDWLDEHHATTPQAWLRIARASSGLATIAIRDAGDVALCFGWIDSHRRGLDEHSFRQRYSPRRSGSPWSLVNRERTERLLAAGRVRPAGLAEIEAARQDGRWEAAYAPQAGFVVPPDLAAALATDAVARAAFDALGRTQQYLLALPLLKSRPGHGRGAALSRAMEALRRNDS